MAERKQIVPGQIPSWRAGALLWRPLDDGREITVYPTLMGGGTIAVGPLGDPVGYDVGYDYEDQADAIEAAQQWDGEGEPKGWVRCTKPEEKEGVRRFAGGHGSGSGRRARPVRGTLPPDPQPGDVLSQAQIDEVDSIQAEQEFTEALGGQRLPVKHQMGIASWKVFEGDGQVYHEFEVQGRLSKDPTTGDHSLHIEEVTTRHFKAWS